MMDFVVRESRANVDPDTPMLIVRLGSCGGLRPEVPVGTVAVAKEGSIAVIRDPDAFRAGRSAAAARPYRLSAPVLPDAQFTASLTAELSLALGPARVLEAMNATACSFYSSQGRPDSAFDDRNENLVADMIKSYPNLAR